MSESNTVIEGLAPWELEHVSGIQSAVDEGDAAMFRMARRVGTARDAGMTQQRIADNIRKPNGDTYTRQWVHYVERALVNHDLQPDDSWAECWNYALGRGAHGRGENPDGDEWYTPRWLFDALGLVFALDVAAPPGGVPWIPADAYFTKEDDGLTQQWTGTVWCNPPYSAITDWARQWIVHGDGVLLVPFVKSAWLAEVANAAGNLWIPPKGIDFESPDGGTKALSYMVFLAGIGMPGVEAVERVHASAGGALR